MSRSLGVLTLDLVAKTGGFVRGMDKAERQSKQWRRQVQRDMKEVGRAAKVGLGAITVGAGLAGAALVGLTKKGLETVDAQAKLARSLDTTYDSVSALSLAFGDAGLNNWEKSLTRMNRRLGAAERGMGEARHTIDELGLSLSDLSDMDAAERIEAIADAIQQSGVSAQKAARMAQDLGFEQAEAAGMFLQGGSAIRAYREEIDALGLSMDGIDAIKVEQANDAFARIGRVFDGLSQQLAVEFAPILHAVSDMFVQNAKDAGGLGNVVEDSFNSVITGAGFVIDAVEGIRRTFKVAGSAISVGMLTWQKVILETAEVIVNGPIKAVNDLIALFNALPGVDIAPVGLSGLGQTIRDELFYTDKAIKEGLKDIEKTLLEPMPSETFKNFVAEARFSAEEAAQESSAAMEKAMSRVGKSISDGVAEEVTDTTEKAVKSAADPMEDYIELVKQLRTEEEQLTDKLRERLGVLDAVNGASDEAYRRSIDDAMSGAPSFGGLAPEVGGPFGELAKIEDAEADLDAWYNRELDRLERFRESRSDLNEFWNEQELSLKQQHEDELAQIERARQMASLAATEQIFGNMADITRQFAGEQSEVYRTMFAIQKAAAIAQSLVAIQQGIAMAAANPWPANLAAMASVAAATASIVGNIQSISLTGMAHDGIDSVPQTGTWLLEKGERVMTAETSKKLDQKLDGGGGVTVNLIEDNSRAGKVEKNKRDDGSTEINAFVADIMGDGPRSRALQSAYGLRRQGR